MSDTPEYTINTVDAFKDFEPFCCGEKAIPDALYFLSKKGNGYQKYDTNTMPGCEPVTASAGEGNNCFTIDGQVITGCKKGTVVKAGEHNIIDEMGSTTASVNIWREKVNGKFIAKYQKDSSSACIIDVENIIRLGILLVGAGGAGGSDLLYYTDCDGCNDDFYISIPGSGGGGGGCCWCILKLDKSTSSNSYFRIEVGNGGQSPGNSGGSTCLYFVNNGTKKELLRANGGKGGNPGHQNGVSDSSGGSYQPGSGWENYIYFKETQWATTGNPGTGYSNDETRASDVKNIYVSFLTDPTGDFTQKAENPLLLGFGTKKSVMDAKGDAYLATPGGNSWGHGGKCNENGNFVRVSPTKGGGGMSYGRYNTSKLTDDDMIRAWSTYIVYENPAMRDDSTWANYRETILDFINSAVPCIRGASGYWMMFY